MKHESACIPCSRKQACRVYTVAERAQGREPTPEALNELSAQAYSTVIGADPKATPAGVSYEAIQLAHQRSGCFDPFLKEKEQCNQFALSLYPRLKQDVMEALDPVLEAALLAVSGNIIDLGIQEEFDMESTLAKVRRDGFAINHLDDFRSRLSRQSPEENGIKLLYLCDNAGEIVFDRVFIETLLGTYPGLSITAVVNSGPILNDAVMADAEMVGLTDVVPVIENGHDDLGTVLERCNETFLRRYREADVIVSKGQANYECLDERGEPIYFILKAKCDVIAGSLGVKLYDAVFVTFTECRRCDCGSSYSARERD